MRESIAIGRCAGVTGGPLDAGQPRHPERCVPPFEHAVPLGTPDECIPKTTFDRMYLAFVAARYRGDKRLSRPDALEIPGSVSVHYGTHLTGWTVTAVSIVMMWVGATPRVIALTLTGAAVMMHALVAIALHRVRTIVR